MVDNAQPPVEQSDTQAARTPGGLFRRVLRDGLVGAVAGAVGDVAVLGSLLVATVLGGFSLEAFTRFPALFGFDALLSPDGLLVLGLGSFVVGGMVVWPLVLATIGAFLPGDSNAARGLVFGAVIWTGFVGYFYTGAAGAGLVVYLVLSMLGHLGYGFLTGATMDRLFGDDAPLVTSAVRGSGGTTAAPESGDADTAPLAAGDDPAGGGSGDDGRGAPDGDGDDGRDGDDDGGEPVSSAESGEAAGAAAERGDRQGATTGDEALGTLRDLDETAERVPPLLRFREALLKIREEVEGDLPAEYDSAVGNYLSLAREPVVRPADVNDLRGYILALNDVLPQERAVQRWVDSMQTRVQQYLDTHDTSETLHLAGLDIYEDGEAVASVADLQGELATVEPTVLNSGEESGAVVRLEFRRGDDEPLGEGRTDGEDSVLLRSDDLSMGYIGPGERKTMSTQVYVPSIAEWVDARVLDPRDGQAFLADVDEVRD